MRPASLQRKSLLFVAMMKALALAIGAITSSCLDVLAEKDERLARHLRTSTV